MICSKWSMRKEPPSNTGDNRWSRFGGVECKSAFEGLGLRPLRTAGCRERGSVVEGMLGEGCWRWTKRKPRSSNRLRQVDRHFCFLYIRGTNFAVTDLLVERHWRGTRARADWDGRNGALEFLMTSSCSAHKILWVPMSFSPSLFLVWRKFVILCSKFTQ